MNCITTLNFTAEIRAPNLETKSKVNSSTSLQKPKTKSSNNTSHCGLQYTQHMAPERWACTLYLRKAVWTRRAASYSSLCSGSDRVSWARSRSTLLLEALMNSLQSAGDGSVDLSRDPSLSGDPPGLRLGLEDGVRGSLYRDLRKEDDRNSSSCTPILFSSLVQQ